MSKFCGKGSLGGHSGKGSKGFAVPRPPIDEDVFEAGPVCLCGIDGDCADQEKRSCKWGQHPKSRVYPRIPEEAQVFSRITRAKMQLLQTKWQEAGGHGYLVGGWQVQNKRLDRLFRATAHNLQHDLGCTSDMIDGWHGTMEDNVLSIARNGFDPRRRAGQVYGAGEYFAKNPQVSVGYCRGGSFMFLCKLLLGTEDEHHTWVKDMKYYVMKQHEGMMQALPVYLVQFQASIGRLRKWFDTLEAAPEVVEASALQARQRGGQTACKARPDAGMTATSTSRLWLGWLAPELTKQNDDAVSDDVAEFLKGLEVEEVLPERNGARIGAYAKLKRPISKAQYEELSARLYRGRFSISVDDAQPQNPRCAGKVCPRLSGPSKFCRGWNIVGHNAWNWGCPFDHPEHLRPTYKVEYWTEPIHPGSAKYDEIETAMMQSAPFHNGMPTIVGIEKVMNQALEHMYEKRRAFLAQKHGFALEKELWHGTNCKAITELLTNGLQPPSDTKPSDKCPVSGNKGLSTTLCSTGCKHCTEPHVWCKCHMYGLGIYLADMAQKSHRYVREPERRKVSAAAGPSSGVGATIEGIDGDVWGKVVADNGHCWRLESGRIAKKETEGFRWNWKAQRGAAAARASWGVGATILGADWSAWGRVVADEGSCWRLDSGRSAKKETEGSRWWWDEESAAATDEVEAEVYSMLWCRVCLGSPYLIEGNLLGESAMHSVCWCQDPSEQLETLAEDWNVAAGHDTYYVRGLGGAQRAGLGVYNSEYIVFQPFQVLPLYRVDYTISAGHY